MHEARIVYLLPYQSKGKTLLFRSLSFDFYLKHLDQCKRNRDVDEN